MKFSFYTVVLLTGFVSAHSPRRARRQEGTSGSIHVPFRKVARSDPLITIPAVAKLVAENPLAILSENSIASTTTHGVSIVPDLFTLPILISSTHSILSTASVPTSTAIST